MPSVLHLPGVADPRPDLDTLRVAVLDHQGKSHGIAAALVAAGHEIVADPSAADVVLIDHDVPFHGKLPAVEACVAAGGRAFLYPHGGNPARMADWDGVYPVCQLLSGALVTAPGHAEVARRYGYEHPVFPVGWSLCELRERRVTGRVERVLFAPEHDPQWPEENAEVFERLLELPYELTVRHIGSLERNGLWEAPGVRYVQGQIGDLDAMLGQIDTADAVVTPSWSFLTLAVARGITAVATDTARLWNNERTVEAANGDLYRDYVAYPFNAKTGELGELVEAAAADAELAADWRARFVGGPLDVVALDAALREDESVAAYVPSTRPSLAARLHAGALAALEQGRPSSAHAVLQRAVAESIDLELVNDLAVLRLGLGDPEEAEALLRASLAIDPNRADAAENLAALPARSTRAGWRQSRTLGGPDPDMPERAFPGMKPESAPLMSEHAVRYAHALTFVGGRHVLDLGCGTGYGSEMLTWAAASVRGFDLWQPADDERPVWPGGAVLTYGHDLCRDPLPKADLAIMFEVLEHLEDAPAALRLIWSAVDTLVVSFPNPVYHGSHHNPYHVNDWPLERVEREVAEAAATRFRHAEIGHLTQAPAGIVVPGRDPNGYYWILVVRGVAPR